MHEVLLEASAERDLERLPADVFDRIIARITASFTKSMTGPSRSASCAYVTVERCIANSDLALDDPNA